MFVQFGPPPAPPRTFRNATKALQLRTDPGPTDLPGDGVVWAMTWPESGAECEIGVSAEWLTGAACTPGGGGGGGEEKP